MNLNGKKLILASNSPRRRELLAGLNVDFEVDTRNDFEESFPEDMPHCEVPAAMSLCYVAAGRLDGYAERYIGQWDFMAGACIVREAGGRVTDYEGDEDFMDGDCVVATNGVIHITPL